LVNGAVTLAIYGAESSRPPHYEPPPALTVEIDVAGVVDDLIESHTGLDDTLALTWKTEYREALHERWLTDTT
jgi:hypothetical protein